MAYCTKCGKQLEPNARYCVSCGAPVIGNDDLFSHENGMNEGRVHECPACHATINAFVSKCPYCNHEFRDSKSTNSLVSISRRIQEIDSKKTSFFSQTDYVQKTYAKIDLIRSYPIPNTKEDIVEFALMANTNIDAQDNRRDLSNAWLGKLEQTYRKAQLSLGNDPAVEMIRKMYEEKRKAMEFGRKKDLIVMLSAALFLVMILLIYFLAMRSL
ncbi:MAG: zinc ribbon domain-containing protein [Acetatifactor sp.]|nr:zinc ribbon domain-containing protein [Acetatifactor sp.]